MGEVVVFVVGLLMGSFLNATAWRVRSRRTATARTRGPGGDEPSTSIAGREGSIWLGRSACPRCGHELAPLDLVPVLSWLLLRGRCRFCSEAISVRYPMTELATAVAFTLAYTAL